MTEDLYEEIADLNRERRELEKHRFGAALVRFYVQNSEGSFEILEGSELAEFEGVIPSVGDIISVRRPAGFESYVVDRRIHVSALTRRGWAVLLSPRLKDPAIDDVVDQWYFEAQTWDETVAEELSDIRDRLRSAEERRDAETEAQRLAVEKAKAERKAKRLARKPRSAPRGAGG